MAAAAGALTKEQLFSGAMLANMTELGGGFLKKFCETKTATGGESVTFNRLGESVASDGVIPSMYGDSATPKQGGGMEAFVATIGEVVAQMKVKESDMNKTSVDIKSSYVKSLGNAVMRKEDAHIIDKISKAGVLTAGDVAADISAEANVKVLVAQIRKAQALADYTPDGHKGVALVLTPTSFAELSTADVMLNSDYSQAFGGGYDGKPTTFFGAEVILIKPIATVMVEGTGYIVPSNTVCFAEWEGSMAGDAVFVPTDGRQWHLQAYKSVGAVVAEKESIVKFTSKPSTIVKSK